MNYNELAQQKASEYKTVAGPFDLMVPWEQYKFIKNIIAQKIYRFIAGKKEQQADCLKDIQGYLRCMKQYCPNMCERVPQMKIGKCLNTLKYSDFNTYTDFKEVAEILMSYFLYNSENELMKWEKTKIFKQFFIRLKDMETVLYKQMGVTW